MPPFQESQHDKVCPFKNTGLSLSCILPFQLPPLKIFPLTVMWWRERRWSSMYVFQDTRDHHLLGTEMGSM